MADYMSSQKRPSDPLLHMSPLMEEAMAPPSSASRRRRSTAKTDIEVAEARELQQRLQSAEMINEQLRLQLSRAEADLALSGKPSLENMNRAVRCARWT